MTIGAGTYEGTLVQFRNGDLCQVSYYWALPHPWFDYWVLPHQWFDFGALPHQWFEGLYPDQCLTHLQ